MKKTVVVIGGGPGGYVSAIRGAQLGAEVHLVEKQDLGGTCLNVGCIPTKALLHTAQLYRDVTHGQRIGLLADNIRIDWAALMKKKSETVSRLVNGVGGLLKANKVKIYKGKAFLKDAHSVQVQNTALAADYIILATGSEPVRLNFPGADLPGVIDSTEALNLPALPASLLIVGGGVIGVEFAQLYSSLGTKVTVVEMLEEILPGIDREIAKTVRRELEQNGVTCLTGSRLVEVNKKQEMLTARVACCNGDREIAAQYVLVAVGRKPCIGGIGLENAGVATEKGKITVDNHFRTSIPHIYAIGDCNGQIMLAHAASAQGIAAVEDALGHAPDYQASTIPSCIYTFPEAAGVGLTEEQAIQRGIRCKVGKFLLSGNGKALIDNEGKGLVKIIAGEKYGEILGVHIIGPHATDLIAEAALAIRLEATVDELISTVHAHPTVSEAVLEAALDVKDIAIHWPPKVKV